MNEVLDIIPDEIEETEYQEEVSRLTRRSNWAKTVFDSVDELETILDAIREYDGDFTLGD